MTDLETFEVESAPSTHFVSSAGVGTPSIVPNEPTKVDDDCADQLFDTLYERSEDCLFSSNKSCTLGDEDTASLVENSKHDGRVDTPPLPKMPTVPWSSLFKDSLISPVWLDQISFKEVDEDCVSMADDDVQHLETAWGYSVIGYVAGKFPGKKALMSCCQR